MEKPVYRYEAEKDSADLLDGALFVFVRGTDPDVWLLLEAVLTAGQPAAKWQFAVARMNSIEITVEHNGLQRFMSDAANAESGPACWLAACEQCERGRKF